MFEEDKEPDFINDEGTKFWIDRACTDYARKEDQFGTSLNVIIYLVESNTGYRTRLIVDAENGDIVDENTNIEHLGAKIDMLKVAKRHETS